MIYTVTFNPAIDYLMQIDSLTEGVTNRSLGESFAFGGKGINVSCVLSQLGVENTALGFVAGFTGNALEEHLKSKGIRTDFIKLDNGITRINIKLKGNCETEINAQGPEISKDAINDLFRKLDNIKSGDTLVLAGSVPNSLPKDIYEQILNRLSDKNIKFIVDATGNLLLNTLKYKPFLIKPNKQELEGVSGCRLNTDDDIISAAKELQKLGAQNVLVSLGGDCSVLLDETGKIHRQKAYCGKVLNSVGAGDSMLAGFLCGIQKGYDYAFELSLAAGSATAFSYDLATKEEIYNLLG